MGELELTWTDHVRWARRPVDSLTSKKMTSVAIEWPSILCDDTAASEAAIADPSFLGRDGVGGHTRARRTETDQAQAVPRSLNPAGTTRKLSFRVT